MNKPTFMKVAKKHKKTVALTKFALLQKMHAEKKYLLEAVQSVVLRK